MLEKKIRLEYAHRILFTREVFAPANTTIRDLLLLDQRHFIGVIDDVPALALQTLARWCEDGWIRAW